jgi:four helix bundle protein
MDEAARFASYRDLLIWQKSMEVAEACHRLTGCLPREEQFGLSMQIRRAAGSIPANLAEGWGRHRDAEMIRYCEIANGSRTELETHLLLAQRLSLVPPEGVEPILQQCDEIGRMITGFIASIRRRSPKKTTQRAKHLSN